MPFSGRRLRKVAARRAWRFLNQLDGGRSARPAPRRTDDRWPTDGRRRPRLAPYWSMTRSQVYRELPVLADQGLVRLGKPARAPASRTRSPRPENGHFPLAHRGPGRDKVRHPVALRVAFGPQHSATQLRHLCAGAATTTPRRLAAGPRAGQGRQESRRLVRRRRSGVPVGYHKAALAWLKAVRAAHRFTGGRPPPPVRPRAGTTRHRLEGGRSSSFRRATYC